MKKFCGANFFLWTFEYGVLFRKFHFNMGMYRGLGITCLTDRPDMTSKMRLLMSILLITLPWVNNGARNRYFTWPLHFYVFFSEKTGNFSQKITIFAQFWPFLAIFLTYIQAGYH